MITYYEQRIRKKVTKCYDDTIECICGSFIKFHYLRRKKEKRDKLDKHFETKKHTDWMASHIVCECNRIIHEQEYATHVRSDEHNENVNRYFKNNHMDIMNINSITRSIVSQCYDDFVIAMNRISMEPLPNLVKELHLKYKKGLHHNFYHRYFEVRIQILPMEMWYML